MDCVACSGAGCSECKRGLVEITGCPLDLVDSEIWELLDYADLYEKGLAPVAGGALDQTQAFLKACKFIWNENNYWKNKLKVMH